MLIKLINFKLGLFKVSRKEKQFQLELYSSVSNISHISSNNSTLWRRMNHLKSYCKWPEERFASNSTNLHQLSPYANGPQRSTQHTLPASFPGTTTIQRSRNSHPSSEPNHGRNGLCFTLEKTFSDRIFQTVRTISRIVPSNQPAAEMRNDANVGRKLGSLGRIYINGNILT